MGRSLSDSELLRRLVSFDSTSTRSVLPIADFVADYLDRPGIRLERFPCPDDDKVNLVATIGPEPDAESRAGLVLSGHLDVVPAVEPEWTTDPFEMAETEDAFVGRGTADMKGFVALALNAAVEAAQGSLEAPLVLLITCDEELGTVGARHLADAWPDGRPLPRRAVIGEPTSLEVVRMHKGHCKIGLTVRGRSAHSGYPHLGHNAIEPMGEVLCGLRDLRRRLEAEGGPNAEHFPEVPFATLIVATILGGSAMNIVPDRCELGLGFRVLPGMETGDVLARVRKIVERALEGEDWNWEILSESPPMLLGEDSDLHSTLCRWVDQRESRSASYATDAGWIQHLGCECVLCGPGTIEVAHRPNESIPRGEMAEGARLVRRMIRHWCPAS